jgi:cytoskeletal protein CcmA (bactofilin family)
MTRRLALALSCLLFGAVASAEEISISESIRIGAEVEISEPVHGPVNAAGGRIRLNAAVDGSARLAGGKVEIGPDAVIGKNASLAGGSVTVEGAVRNNLQAAGGQVTINGPVGGDASIAAGTLELGPNARIGGKLTFRGGKLNRDPGAQVAGAVEHVPSRVRAHRHERTPGERFLRGWMWTLGLMLLAAIIAGVLPGPSQRMAQELRERPWMTPLLGFIALTSIPIAAVLVMVTIIGIPLGLLALLGYVALLLIGYVWLSVVVGGLLLDRFKAETAALTAWRVGAAVLTMLVIALLVRIPIVGGFVAFAALIVGVGMIVAVVLRRTPQAATA